MNGINLLTDEYKERAGAYASARRTAAVTAVLFLSLILIVLISSATVGIMQAAVYRNTALNPDAAEAERLHRLAAGIRRQNENAARYFTNENIDIALLNAVASAADGIIISGIELDGSERGIYVDGAADTEALLTGFVERLRAERLFTEIGLTELERRDGYFYFLLELKPGESL